MAIYLCLVEFFQEPQSTTVNIASGNWTRLAFILAYSTSSSEEYQLSLQVSLGSCPPHIDTQLLPYYHVDYTTNTTCPTDCIHEGSTQCDKLLIFTEGRQELHGHIIKPCLLTSRDGIAIPSIDFELSLSYTIHVIGE